LPPLITFILFAIFVLADVSPSFSEDSDSDSDPDSTSDSDPDSASGSAPEVDFFLPLLLCLTPGRPTSSTSDSSESETSDSKSDPDPESDSDPDKLPDLTVAPPLRTSLAFLAGRSPLVSSSLLEEPRFSISSSLSDSDSELLRVGDFFFFETTFSCARILRAISLLLALGVWDGLITPAPLTLVKAFSGPSIGSFPVLDLFLDILSCANRMSGIDNGGPTKTNEGLPR
jgi:hypothetical protein